MKKSKQKARYRERKAIFNIADQLVKDEGSRKLLLALLIPLKGSNSGVLTQKECYSCNELRTALILILKRGASADGYMPKKTEKEFLKTWRGDA
ncbi:MAG TPA: hypothetical protein EYN67_00760 [Flavobacteriales bacterium]|nr:hypothetical protein [Flavobacteriales bacterium]